MLFEVGVSVLLDSEAAVSVLLVLAEAVFEVLVVTDGEFEPKSGNGKKSFDVSQHPSPGGLLISGRLASQQYFPELHSLTASFPEAVLPVQRLAIDGN